MTNPTYRARIIRFLVKHSIGRMYRKAGQSIPALRKLDDVLIRNQSPPKGTRVSSAELNGISGEWIRGPGAG